MMIKIGKVLISIALFVYVLENTYFGWNKLPMSVSESRCDEIVVFLFRAGVFFYFLPLYGLYENAVKRSK